MSADSNSLFDEEPEEPADAFDESSNAQQEEASINEWSRRRRAAMGPAEEPAARRPRAQEEEADDRELCEFEVGPPATPRRLRKHRLAHKNELDRRAQQARALAEVGGLQGRLRQRERLQAHLCWLINWLQAREGPATVEPHPCVGQDEFVCSLCLAHWEAECFRAHCAMGAAASGSASMLSSGSPRSVSAVLGT